jgi:hypothetical protein
MTQTLCAEGPSLARFISIYFEIISMGDIGKRGCFGSKSKGKGKINRKKNEMP